MSALLIHGVAVTGGTRRLRVAATPGTLGRVEPRPWAVDFSNHANWYREA